MGFQLSQSTNGSQLCWNLLSSQHGPVCHQGLPKNLVFVGVGQARQVVFWLGPVSGISSDSVLERDCSNPEYTVTYELLLENENSLVVISPKGGQKAIEFDRKAVGAVILLGERPSYAPANYRRAVSEAPVSGPKCQNP